MLHAAESQAERAAASLADQEHGRAHNLLQRQSRREKPAPPRLCHAVPHQAFYVSMQDIIAVQVQKALEHVKSDMRSPLVPDKLRPMLI